jgi:hypothetical protein
LAEDRKKPLVRGEKYDFGGLSNKFIFINGTMRPDYSHKIFDDKRLHHFFLRKAFVREALGRL